ncbi:MULTISPECIES: c-type cytochrome [Chromobacterium]|uniref:Cytochrome C n=2 Tax=Chromobacterium violaceum TaxID=536 RepID=A0A1R0MHG3_CHRVL|nr:MULTISPECIES: cytochrome c [Chromobacterium]AAQ60531.1 hypothetical protein CV_2863 [Chromobacterium violaceum ATCC 12472]ATP29223.1 cytochrome C [Chromobacterium violaceum]ATP33132.1 cytochrome C [Chromobacterium violaceum]AVG17714.1 cytochrome C [Chromobacterium vaccinii]MBA8737082.1 cytochrome c [Chromobacterium violaceum]
MRFHVSMILACSCFYSLIAAASDGKALYQQNCAVCHGAHAQGKTGPRLAGDASKWRKQLFERAVLEGVDDEGKALKAPMPHWGNSSLKEDHGKPPTKEEVDAIQAYLKTLH